MKYPAGAAIIMSIEVYIHIQHTLLRLLINWRLVSTPRVWYIIRPLYKNMNVHRN